jgi:carboxylesterase type B
MTSANRSGYLDNDLSLAANITATYAEVSLAELGKGYSADPTAPDDFYRAMAVYSDLWMHLGRRALLRKASPSQPTWGYIFEQQPPISTLNLSYEYPGYTDEYYRRLGVYHGAELPYVFGEISSVVNSTGGDVDLASRIMSWYVYRCNDRSRAIRLTHLGGSRLRMNWIQIWMKVRMHALKSATDD